MTVIAARAVIAEKATSKEFFFRETGKEHLYK
jgi:hypothetical protein